MPAEERRRLSVDISEAAFDGWAHATRLYGGDKRALVEVIGEALAEFDMPRNKLPRHWKVLFTEAERRRMESNRGRGRPRRA